MLFQVPFARLTATSQTHDGFCIFFRDRDREQLPDARGTGRRIDQMDKCGHYARWEEDFALLSTIGVNALRYGPAYYLTHPAPRPLRLVSADAPMERLRELGITVIADLCHFGVPDWLGGFQDMPSRCFSPSYAREFAQRYPWVRYYTPVNEIFICASFSALRGWWNECLASDRGLRDRACEISAWRTSSRWRRSSSVRPTRSSCRASRSSISHRWASAPSDCGALERDQVSVPRSHARATSSTPGMAALSQRQRRDVQRSELFPRAARGRPAMARARLLSDVRASHARQRTADDEPRGRAAFAHSRARTTIGIAFRSFTARRTA